MKLDCTCSYCKMNTFLWEVDSKQIWVEIPKNGSYNLKTNLYNYDSRFPIESQPNSKISKIYKIDLDVHASGFVIIRNPIERFKSLLSHYFFHGGRFAKGFGARWMELISVKNYDKNNIASIVLDNFENINKIEDPHHFNSQFSFIPINFFNLNSYKIYNLSEVSRVFGLMDGINSSRSNDINLEPGSIQRIKEIYEDDFDLYSRYLK